MITNQLILYCHRLDQAVLWEACKIRKCATSRCLFKRIAKQYGEELWAASPFRISSVQDVKEHIEKLTKPIPLVRTPVLDDVLPPPVEIRTSSEKPRKTGMPLKTLSELAKQDIEEEIAILM